MSPSTNAAAVGLLDDSTLDFYRDAMALMDAGGLEYLVGGAYAFAQYSGIVRHTKDFDVFLRGADVAHLINAVGERFDWRHLIMRYGRYWRALYAHLILFGFIYPSDRWKIPSWVMEMMAQRLAIDTERGEAYDKICYGTILSRQ